MFQPHVILHPTDYSTYSAHAFEIAVDLAQQNQAALLILHVVETLGPENLTYGEAMSQLEPQGYQERLWADLRQLKVPAEAKIAVEYLLAEGDPAHEIERVARDRPCDLIVMGTHGRIGLSRLLMGSIAEEVVRRSACNVLVVKSHPPKADASVH